MPHRREAPAARAERALRRRIAAGLLPAGERLPAEATLATELEVSRTSLRRAFDRLEADGLLVHDPGTGRRVAAGLAFDQRAGLGIVGLLAPHVPGLDETRGIHVGSTTAVQVAALHALAAAGFNALQLAPARLRGSGISPRVTDLLGGAIALFEATRLAAVQDFLHDCRREGIPLVVQADGLELDGTDAVLSDHEGGTALLVARLAELGCRRIQRVWDHNGVEPWPLPWIPLRDRGYSAACERLALPVLPPVRAEIPDGLSWDRQVALARQALEPLVSARQPPDALLLLTDGVVARHAAALRTLDREPNRDLAVCGFDHYWDHMVDRGDDPPLLSLDKCNPAVGRELVAVLRERLAAGPGSAMVRTVAGRVVTDRTALDRWRASGRR